MKYYAPFSSKWNYWMLSIDDTELNLVRLNLKTTLKFALYEQINIFSAFINDLKNNANNVTLRKQKHYKFNLKKDIKIELIRNKHFGDKLIISSKNQEFKIQIPNSIDKEKLFTEIEGKMKIKLYSFT